MIRQAESMALSRQWTKRFLNVRNQSVLACGQNDCPISSAILKFSTMWIVAEEEKIVSQEIRITFSLRELFVFCVPNWISTCDSFRFGVRSIGKFGCRLSFEMDISDFAIKHEIRHQAGGFQLRNPIPDFFFLGNPKLGIAKLFSWTAEIHEVLVFEMSIWFSCINVNPKSGVESALYYCTIVIG